jgi:hypothetical protein
MGPDRFIWTFLDKVLVRIDPESGKVYSLGQLDPGDLAFVGRDLYLGGTYNLRRLRDIVPKKLTDPARDFPGR